ncbi:hypothetical protein EW145_g2878 [Phellinidium pouzarii]|uniref:Uncharacterized protein n=1 Tax=Phellinidium pouzarii TaxID=167371 RepID=A0A4S4LER2_9AGAM|nr:hypothetical protein EW145_g2878 [Phellinidium pouzarii]
MHAIIAGTGSVVAIAALVMGPVSDVVLDTFGDSLLIEVRLSEGYDASTKIANDLVIDHTFKHAIPAPAASLSTTGIKHFLVTLMYKHTLCTARLLP